MADKPATQSELLAFKTETDQKFDKIQVSLDALLAFQDETARRFNSLEQMIRDIQSRQVGVQLSGELVPPPTDGVVNPEEDSMLLHRQTTATRRYKGAGVVCVFVAKRRTGKSRKFE